MLTLRAYADVGRQVQIGFYHTRDVQSLSVAVGRLARDRAPCVREGQHKQVGDSSHAFASCNGSILRCQYPRPQPKATRLAPHCSHL